MPWERAAPVQVQPPCETCRVDPDPEGIEIINVWFRCKDDWIMSGGMTPSRMTLAGPAIYAAINLVGIRGKRNRLRAYDIVKAIGREVAAEIRAEQERLAEKLKDEN